MKAIIAIILGSIVVIQQVWAQRLYVAPSDTPALINALCQDKTNDASAVGNLSPVNPCKITCLSGSRQTTSNQPDGEYCAGTSTAPTSFCYNGNCLKKLGDDNSDQTTICTSLGLKWAIAKPGQPCIILCIPADRNTGRIVEAPNKPGNACYRGNRRGQCAGTRCTF